MNPSDFIEMTGRNKEEIDALFKKANELREVLGTYFEKEELEVGIVASVLMSMLVDIMIQNETPPHHAILMFGTLVASKYADEEEDEADNEGENKWQN
jgi:hypothetical protein